MVAAVAAVWFIELCGVSFICLAALVAACFSLRDYLYSSGINRDEAQAPAVASELHGRSRASLSELASRLAEWCGHAWLLCTAACTLRKRHPGWFCAVSSAAFLSLIALSRALSGAVVSTLIVAFTFSWPLATVYDLLPRLYLYFEPMLVRLEYSLKAGCTVDGNDGVHERAVPQSGTRSSSSSLLGSFMLDVSEMPSHEDSSYDSLFAISSVMSPGSSIVCSQSTGHAHAGDDVGMPGELDFALSKHDRVDGAGSSDLCDGSCRSADVLFAACNARLDAPLGLASRPAAQDGEAAAGTPSAAAAQALPPPAAVPPQSELDGTFAVHRLPSALRTVAQTVLDTVSHLPMPASLWHSAGKGRAGIDDGGPSAGAAAEPVGEDSDFEFVTNDDFIDGCGNGVRPNHY